MHPIVVFYREAGTETTTQKAISFPDLQISPFHLDIVISSRLYLRFGVIEIPPGF